jgi:hypothetical protein
MTAMATEDSSEIGQVLVDWRRVGFFYKQLLERLENESFDGTFLIPGRGGGGSAHFRKVQILSKIPFIPNANMVTLEEYLNRKNLGY